MAKATNKVVDRNHQDELDAAIAAEAEARGELESAEAAFSAKYPDRRLIGAGVISFADDEQIDREERSRQHRERFAAYTEELDAIAELERRAAEAGRHVERCHELVSQLDEDQARGELKSAIAKRHSAEAEVKKLRDAVDRAEALVNEAEADYHVASETVEAATAARAEMYAAAIEQGHAPGRDDAVSDARRRANDTADRLAAARTAALAFGRKLEVAEERLRTAESDVLAAAKLVATTAAPRLLHEAQALREELEARRQVLWVLDHIASRPHGSQSEIERFLEDVVFPYECSDNSAEEHSAAAPWLAAIEALALSADAPLPG